MASIRRQGARCEIRECLVTERGPRQHGLASFTGVLTPQIVGDGERIRANFARMNDDLKADVEGNC